MCKNSIEPKATGFPVLKPPGPLCGFQLDSLGANNLFWDRYEVGLI